ncbi:MAG: hypothetical protein PHD51_02170 [Patescibacteria group bacterium]|nr:hypothetical protein [Patescibacteria group bacterium]MDD5490333.1 hypothetical protein [Patescibacteria group bacterium]
MDIEVDYNPTPSTMFFISVSVNEKEAISFDYTTKAHRVVKQVLIDKKPFPADRPISSEWDALVLKDGKFIQKYHVKWINMGKQDWCNDEIWETVKEQLISDELSKKLLNYSRIISDNYGNLHKFSNEMKSFEQLLSKEMAKF